MMHYGPWVNQQPPPEVIPYYPPYLHLPVPVYHSPDHLFPMTEELSEPTADDPHDVMTPLTSGERSSGTDFFRLEFAASQWSKLVSNAEGLFTKLVTSNLLPHTEQDQIEQWLCMKQEYEEVIANDDTISLQRRSLERIEEVTETEDRTEESERRAEANCGLSDSLEGSDEDDEEEEEDDDDDEDMDPSEEEDQSDGSPDFLEKLDECMNQLKLETDRLINMKRDEFRETPIELTPTKSNNSNNNNLTASRPAVRHQGSRRNSMLPGSEMCNEVLAFTDSHRSLQPPPLPADPELDNNPPAQDLLTDTLKTDNDSEPIRALKTLTMNKEAKQMQVRKLQSDSDGAHKRIEELETTIKIKEKFIADMIKNSDTRASARQKFQRKSSKLEEEYYNARTQLAQAENASLYKDSEEKSARKREIELYKTMAIHYEKRLMDIEMIKQIAGDSAKKVIELESSLNTSRKQMEKLKKQLKKEEERKKQLEEELAEDQKKIRELEEKYNMTASKLREIQSESEDERNANGGKSRKKNLQDVSARISHLDHVLKEKSMDLERTADTDEKEALRHEIRNLRRTRDCLIDEKCDLDEKFQKEKTLSTVDERKLLECGETIEAIDAMIEHKNEMICGRTCFDEGRPLREKGERMLMERLSKLSDGEMRTLFYKYFLKVIDLKESSKNLEVQTAELENHVETQEWRIQTLTNALKQTKLEAERRIVLMQRDHEEKLHLMFRHFAEETSSSGHERLDKDSELAKYKRENRALRKRLADVEALLKGQTPRAASPPSLPPQSFKQIAPTTTRPTTKVTRQRNKLIIQKTTDCEKRKK